MEKQNKLREVVTAHGGIWLPGQGFYYDEGEASIGPMWPSVLQQWFDEVGAKSAAQSAGLRCHRIRSSLGGPHLVLTEAKEPSIPDMLDAWRKAGVEAEWIGYPNYRHQTPLDVELDVVLRQVVEEHHHLWFPTYGYYAPEPSYVDLEFGRDGRVTRFPYNLAENKEDLEASRLERGEQLFDLLKRWQKHAGGWDKVAEASGLRCLFVTHSLAKNTPIPAILSPLTQVNDDLMRRAWGVVERKRNANPKKFSPVRWISYDNHQLELGPSSAPMDKDVELEIYLMGLPEFTREHLKNINYESMLRLLRHVFCDDDETVREMMRSHGGLKAIKEKLINREVGGIDLLPTSLGVLDYSSLADPIEEE